MKFFEGFEIWNSPGRFSGNNKIYFLFIYLFIFFSNYFFLGLFEQIDPRFLWLGIFYLIFIFFLLSFFTFHPLRNLRFDNFTFRCFSYSLWISSHAGFVFSLVYHYGHHSDFLWQKLLILERSFATVFLRRNFYSRYCETR